MTMTDIIRTLSFRTTPLFGEDEKRFQQWYANHSASTGLSANPDEPEHKYDWRAAFASGAKPEAADDGNYHWPSSFKRLDHPNRFVNGWDTIFNESVK